MPNTDYFKLIIFKFSAIYKAFEAIYKAFEAIYSSTSFYNLLFY